MKNLFKVLSLIIITALAFASCSKEYKPIPNPNDGTGTNPFLGEFSCNLYGSDLFSSNERYVYDVTDENGIRSLTIRAKEYSDSLDPTVYRIIELHIGNFNGQGDYAVGNATNNMITIAYDKNNIHMFRQISNDPESIISITQADGTNYQGTFQFSVENLSNANEIIPVTNGQFNLKK